jgi:hypothetical protein
LDVDVKGKYVASSGDCDVDSDLKKKKICTKVRIILNFKLSNTSIIDYI